MTDIIERLRSPRAWKEADNLVLEAADEIERLRAALEEIAGHDAFLGGDGWIMRNRARAALGKSVGKTDD